MKIWLTFLTSKMMGAMVIIGENNTKEKTSGDITEQGEDSQNHGRHAITPGWPMSIVHDGNPQSQGESHRSLTPQGSTIMIDWSQNIITYQDYSKRVTLPMAVYRYNVGGISIALIGTIQDPPLQSARITRLPMTPWKHTCFQNVLAKFRWQTLPYHHVVISKLFYPILRSRYSPPSQMKTTNIHGVICSSSWYHVKKYCTTTIYYCDCSHSD